MPPATAKNAQNRRISTGLNTIQTQISSVITLPNFT
jgi:hypothetical protein